MRHAFAFALLFALGCSSAVDPPTRCTPGASVACVCPGVGVGAQVCDANGDSYGACVCGSDAGSMADAPGLDVTSVPDVVVAVPEAGAVDAGVAEDRQTAVDAVAVADVIDAGRCPNGTRAMCDGRWIDLDRGEPDGGIRYHCGACGHHCASGEVCLNCACVR